MNRSNLWKFARGLIYIQLFILVLVAGITVDIKTNLQELSRQGLAVAQVLRPFSRLDIDPRLGEAMLYQSYTGFYPERPTMPLSRWLTSAGILAGSPQDMLETHIQAVAWSEVADLASLEPQGSEPALAAKEVQEKGKMEPVQNPELKNQRLVFYCTHTGETYRPDSGKCRLEGKRGLITRVAANLQKETEARGFTAVYIDTIHDSPYTKSYANSRKTVQQLLDQGNFAALFDIHRDSIPQEKPEVVEIDGKKAAKILIIVGTDERKPHPHWEKNAEFARRILETSQELYPGLIKGVRAKAGTYNQEFHERALLIEVGNDHNSLQEALYSTELLADILGEVFKEMKD